MFVGGLNFFGSADVRFATRAWRQKIEAWLLDSEKEEKQTEEQRRRRRPPTMNRRSTNETSTESTESDIRNGGTNILDTLPEEKTQSGQYRRVYSDWKPTVEKTDVVGTMEAIAGMYPINTLIQLEFL
jgi:inverted formin-2